MKYHTLFISKIRNDVANLSSATVVNGALRVKEFFFTCIYYRAGSFKTGPSWTKGNSL